jgi:hypothetical protein
MKMSGKLKYQVIFIVLFGIGFTSCFQKQINITLPPFKSELVVEGYLEMGRPFQVAVSQTSNFFAAPDLSAVFLQKAKVILSYNNVVDTLVFNPIPDFKNLKWYNYQLKNKGSVPLTVGTVYHLKVIDSTGRIATAQTTWFDSVKIDSVKEVITQQTSVKYDTIMRVYFKDPAATQDFYRFVAINHTMGDSVRQDNYVSDDLFNGQVFSLSTGRNFRHGDTCDITLYHIEQAYYSFLNTSEQADNANGNPFASPGVITSNINGGTGIFTVLPASHARVVFK